MRVRADIEMDLDQILKAVNAEDIAEFYRHRRDVDDLLAQIGTAALVRYLRANERPEFILDEILEVTEVEDYLVELRRWIEIKKKEVG